MMYSSEEEGYENRADIGEKRGGRASDTYGEVVSKA